MAEVTAAGRVTAAMIAIRPTTTTMRMARKVKGSASCSAYFVATKPVLHSTTKIAGAARAANLSKSSVIWRPECTIVCYVATPVFE